MHVGDGRGVDREHGRERIGVLARHDPQQGVALRLAGAPVDECQRLAIAFVDRARPFEDGGDGQAVEPGIAMVAFVDPDAGDGVAMALVGQRVELAVAAIFASAIDQLAALELPISHHDPRFGKTAFIAARLAQA